MDAASAGVGSEAASQLVGLLLSVGVTVAAGIFSAWMLRWDINVRSLPVLVGLLGLVAGRWAFDALGLPPGPLLAGHAVMPTVVGALAIGTVLKLASLGMAGPRW